MADGSQFQYQKPREETPEAKQVVHYSFSPKDPETEKAVEEFRVEHGIRRGKNQISAICGFLATCKALQNRDEWYFAWPCSKAAHGGYRAYHTVRKQLEEHYFTLVKKGNSYSGKANIYLLNTMPDFGRVKFKETRSSRDLVEVRNVKEMKQDWKIPPKGRKLKRKECLSLFGEEKFRNAEERMENIVSYLHDHPLVLNDNEYRNLWRLFNQSSMQHGGRIYGAYSSEKKAYRTTATIDGEPIAQIDVKASFLFVRGAMAGVNLGEGSDYPKDPYQAISRVNSAYARTMHKELVSMMISCGGQKKKFPSDFKKEYSDIIGPKRTIKDFTRPIYEAFPFMQTDEDGLYVMYRESEALMATLENCIDADIPAWPLHDCIFVRESDLDKGVELLKSGFEEITGFRPYISYNLKDQKEVIV